jgi:uncharacterized protein (TIGR02757 family)
MSIKELLDQKVKEYECESFIETDPISIPHMFSRKEDIEIAGFLTATIAWGQRKSILNNARKLMNMMDNSPYDFVMNSTEKELSMINGFVHRTFNSDDCKFFIKSLRSIYTTLGGMEGYFTVKTKENEIRDAILHFREEFFKLEHPTRIEKHVSNPITGSASKKMNMFLRWMVRNGPVDFGIWKNINPSQLYCPLDVHSGRVARSLGLLTRKQDDWKAVEELTLKLREFDSLDPIKYDFALFGLGISNDYKNHARS